MAGTFDGVKPYELLFFSFLILFFCITRHKNELAYIIENYFINTITTNDYH